VSELSILLDELKSIHDGDAWHGPSLKEALAGLTAEQAAARPVSGGHSIWELALHIAAWNGVWARRLEGNPISEPEEGDFPAITNTDDKSWAEALARLDGAQQKLLGAASELTDSSLKHKVAGADYTVEYMLRGAIRHSVYHAGQISLLKRAFSRQ
jgi:uncharacterized damage-inducible protein DinB